MFFLGLHIFTYSDTFQVHKSGPPCLRLSWQSLNLRHGNHWTIGVKVPGATGQNRSRKTIRSSKHLTVCLSDHPFIHVSIFLSVSLSLSLSPLHPSIHPFIHSSMAFSLRMPNWLAWAATLGAKQPRSTIRQWYRSVIYIYIHSTYLLGADQGLV